jgi:hypothetical protein
MMKRQEEEEEEEDGMDGFYSCLEEVVVSI